MVRITTIGYEEFLSVGSDSVIMIPLAKITQIHYRELSVGSWIEIKTTEDRYNWDDDALTKELIEFFGRDQE